MFREAAAVVVVRRRRRYVTRRRRYAILFYFRKLNLHYVLQQKFENDSSSYRKLEDCTLHIVHVLHTLHICDVQPKHCTAHSYCGYAKALRASTVAEAKPVSVGRSRWSLLLLAFARQQIFRKTSSRSSACWGTGHFEFTLEHSSR